MIILLIELNKIEDFYYDINGYTDVVNTIRNLFGDKSASDFRHELLKNILNSLDENIQEELDLLDEIDAVV